MQVGVPQPGGALSGARRGSVHPTRRRAVGTRAVSWLLSVAMAGCACGGGPRRPRAELPAAQRDRGTACAVRSERDQAQRGPERATPAPAPPASFDVLRSLGDSRPFRAALLADGTAHWNRSHDSYDDWRMGVWRLRGPDLLLAADRQGRYWFIDPETGSYLHPGKPPKTDRLWIEGLDWQVARTHILFAHWLREVGPGDWRGLALLPDTGNLGMRYLADTSPDHLSENLKWFGMVARYAPPMGPGALTGVLAAPAAGRYRRGAPAGPRSAGSCSQPAVAELRLEINGRVGWDGTGETQGTAERWRRLDGVWWEVGSFVVVGLRVHGPVEHDRMKIFPTPSALLVLTRAEGRALRVLQCSWDDPEEGISGPEPTLELKEAVESLRCGEWWPVTDP